MDPCVFLDRDGVLNIERGTYTWKIDDFEIIRGVREALEDLKMNGFKLVVITNQAGITRGVFTKKDMQACHQYLMEQTGYLIDDIYYSMYHPDYSNSLLRKPGSLMFEKAIARHQIDPSGSWMVGNSERDLVPAAKLGMRTIFIGEKQDQIQAEYFAGDLKNAGDYIIANQKTG